jgi:SSS family solute:Na+ symporter
MNSIHCLAMVGSLSIVSILSIHAAGGMGHLVNTLPAQTWNLFQPDVPTVIVRCIALTVCMFAASEAATIAIGAKTRKAANGSLVIVSTLIVAFTFLLVMTGISGRILVPDMQTSSTALYSIASTIGPALSVIAAIAVIAAIMSSAPAYMIYFSTGITRDIFARFAPNASEKRMKLFSTFCILALALGGTFVAMRAGSILNFLFCVFEIQSIGGLVLIIALYGKRVSAKSAFWSITIGGAASTIWMILGNPYGIIPAWIVLGFGLVTLLLMTLLEKNKVSLGYTEMRRVMEKYAD